MTVPRYLKPGDTIGITCPAGYVSLDRVAYAKQVLESWGFKVHFGKTVGSEHHYFSGNDDYRLEDLQHMLDDDSVHAILMGRGGYGLTRIIDRVDFTKFSSAPKWICGFSDITVLQQHIQQVLGIATMHAPMGSAFKEETEHAAHLIGFKQALLGEDISISFPYSPYNRIGFATGRLVGGNLAIMAHLTGSRSQAATKNNILFLEDVGEYIYNLDRMMRNLKRAGLFENISGLVFGSFTDVQDTERPFGECWEKVLKNVVAEYQFPVAYNLPCGHDEVNFPLKFGVEYQLHCTDKGSALQELSLC